MTEIVTNQGLNLPDDMSEDQFFEAGRFLARIEHGMQWAIGDWYNAIKWGNKEAACEKAGLSFSSASNYAATCEAYEPSKRLEGLSFQHHKTLAISKPGTIKSGTSAREYALASDQRQSLLKQAEEGTEGKPWPVARLTAERDSMLGRKKPNVTLSGLDGAVEKVVGRLPTSLPKATKAKVERCLNDMKHEVEKATAKQFEKMKHDFDAEVHKRASDMANEQRYKLIEMQKETEKEREILNGLRQNLDGLMTEKEYRLLRACLHPDRAPDGRAEQYDKAMRIVLRMEKSVNREMPPSLRRERGWAA